MSQLAGNTILITGGASGLGRLLALKAARLGARVAIWDIDSGRLAAVLAELAAITSTPPQGCLCDVSDREAVQAAARQLQETLGPVDILVNNAGIVLGRRLMDSSDANIERTLGVNTLGLFWTCRAVLPGMIRSRKGHIVTVASAGGLIGVAGLVAYCTSKWAAVGFDDALRSELRTVAPQIKTTVVCPYYMDTGMFSGVRTKFSWLLPILKAEAVADRIIRAITRDCPRVMMPFLVALVPLLRLVPVAVCDWLVDFLGINQSVE